MPPFVYSIPLSICRMQGEKTSTLRLLKLSVHTTVSSSFTTRFIKFHLQISSLDLASTSVQISPEFPPRHLESLDLCFVNTEIHILIILSFNDWLALLKSDEQKLPMWAALILCPDEKLLRVATWAWESGALIKL